MTNLRAFALYAAIFALALTGNAFAIEPSPAPYVLVDFGYTFEPATGVATTASGVKIPFTFEYALVMEHDSRGNEVVRHMSPLQYGSRDTAIRVLKFVQESNPGLRIEVVEDNQPGPYLFSVQLRSLLIHGEKFNVGLIAHNLFLGGEFKESSRLKEEIQRAAIAQARRDAE